MNLQPRRLVPYTMTFDTTAHSYAWRFLVSSYLLVWKAIHKRPWPNRNLGLGLEDLSRLEEAAAVFRRRWRSIQSTPHFTLTCVATNSR